MTTTCSKAGPLLLFVESVGLGVLGLDRLVVSLYQTVGNDPAKLQAARKERSYAFAKFSLVLAAVGLFVLLRVVSKVSLRDPVLLFPILLFLIWAVWATHDILHVLISILLGQETVMDLNSRYWSDYQVLLRVLAIVVIVFYTIVAWHYLWARTRT